MNTHRLQRTLLAGVGLAHLLPSVAVLSRERVESTYGVAVPDAGTELLLRHRATFFGLLGAALLAGAADTRYRRPALAAGTVSVGSFLALAGSIGAPSPELRRVQRIDVVLLTALGVVAACEVAPRAN
ncbi:hypothetical protein [Tsukamurella pseudospumae]|uniref:Phosphopantetheine adenylyltransferase n=1 Tax=Tsukamurella pseudospumae TaxID=239498 RepID=A0A138AW66_9ACTN|nr:hypothetical protein [Tsukamurella pseudospumae]KXO91174.1 hypothetical protein AXK61_06295 [Tsukamurella pseudospumae]KXP14685.1 hypothetical protein AXK60_02005 [Tsukamurella pseudospumae]